MEPEDTKKTAGMTRRNLLKILAVASAGTAAGGILMAERASADKPAAPEPAGRQWVLVFDLQKCEGCVTTGKPPQCTESCNAEHFVPDGQQWIRVLEVEGPEGHNYFMPRPCMQCENAPCVNVCPVGASYHDAAGVVLVDHNRCIGCRLCMAACPYGARSFNWDQPNNPPGATFAQYSPEYPVPHRKGTVEKCMLCAHRVMDGKLPACSAGCPMFAIYLGDLVQDIATNGQEVVKLSTVLADRSAYRLKEELGTRPRVWYLPGHGQEYGHDLNNTREPLPPRTWEQMGATLDNPQGGHQ